jgi:hypothetical protein
MAVAGDHGLEGLHEDQKNSQFPQFWTPCSHIKPRNRDDSPQPGESIHHEKYLFEDKTSDVM